MSEPLVNDALWYPRVDRERLGKVAQRMSRKARLTAARKIKLFDDFLKPLIPALDVDLIVAIEIFPAGASGEPPTTRRSSRTNC
jgi:hypothetical protein